MISKNECPENIDFSEGEIILIDKPKGITSFDVIRKIRRFIKIKKIGHAGTLDPLASGLLILCTGKKTKIISQIQLMHKIYEGVMFLGAQTPSYDLETKPDKYFDISMIDSSMILENSSKFIGTISQFPPVYSAVKYQGKPMYKRARKGEDINPVSRVVQVDEFDILKIELPFISFKVKCSKGTYIRSLVNDFGIALNNGAYLSDLRRTNIGEYSVSEAYLPEVLGELLQNMKITENL